MNDLKEGNPEPGRTKTPTILQEAAEDSLTPLVLGEEGKLFWLQRQLLSDKSHELLSTRLPVWKSHQLVILHNHT